MKKVLLFATTMLLAVSCIKVVVPATEQAAEATETTEAAAPAPAQEPAAQEPAAQAPAPEQQAIIIVYSNSYDGYINIREQPSSKSKILGKFPNGPQGAKLLSVEGNWSKVDLNGVVGYVYSSYVQMAPTEAVHISASAVIGEWYWSDGHQDERYIIKSNGKFINEFCGEVYDSGTWYLSGYKLVLKYADGTIDNCTVNGKVMDIDGTDFFKE